MRLVNFIFISFLSIVSLTMNAQAKSVYGLYEKVKLKDINNIVIKAKLDTGALTSSFGATDIQFFEKDGKEWVRFKPQIKQSNLPLIEKEVVRHSKIKKRSDAIRDDDNLHAQRPVIMMDICFDGKWHAIEVNLADRSRFNYPLLIGSSTLIELNAIIDPSLKFESKAECKL